MADRMQLLQEADDRGLLPPDMKAAFEEAKKRGLGGAVPTQQSSSGVGDFFKSIGTGLVGGLSSTASLSGQAAQIEMGDQGAPVPTPEQSKGIVEKEITGPLHQPEGAAGRIGQSIGEALGNPASYIGPGGIATKVGGAVLSGAGSEVAGQLTKGTKAEPFARMGGGLVGGTLAGVGAAEAQAVRLSRALPSKLNIKADATAAYDAIAAAKLQATQHSVDVLSKDIQASLDADLIVPASAPRTFRAIEQLEKGGGDVAQMMAIREKLGKIGPQEGTDYAAASHVRDRIDQFIETLDPSEVVTGDPKFTAETLSRARANWKSYKQLDTLDRIGEEAEHRAASTGTGANQINTIRQNVRKILDSDKKSRGFSSEAKEQMERIVMGTWATNSTRYASKFAPSGVISTGFGVLAGEAAGPGVGTAVAGGGLLGRYLGEYLTKRQLRQLEDLIRAESPRGQAAKASVKPTAGLVPAAAARGGAVGIQNVLDQMP